MPAQLVALTEGPSILLDKPIMLFGRNPECDIQIDSRKVSRRHCCIAQVNDYLVVRDLGSTNGIRINGVRMVEGKLTGGDELTIGSHRYQVRWDGLEAPGKHLEPAVEPAQALLGTVREPEEDDMLEDCDEPVPLPEPGASARPAPWFVGPTPPGQAATAVAHEDESAHPAKKGPSSPVLPDDLDLAPSSDMLNPGKAKAES